MSDHQLFSYAKHRIEALRDAGAPFSLTMLTLDTHEPGGVYPTCHTDDSVLMATAIKCSMQAVADFIDYLRSNDYLKDTVVVVMGDHLKATSEAGFYKTELDSQADRTIIFRVWSPTPVTFNREHADQLSVLPTTLDLLGMDPPDGRAGLGVSLIGHHELTDTACALPSDEYATLMGGALHRHLPKVLAEAVAFSGARLRVRPGRPVGRQGDRVGGDSRTRRVLSRRAIDQASRLPWSLTRQLNARTPLKSQIGQDLPTQDLGHRDHVGRRTTP